jgi:hypothetical protein
MYCPCVACLTDVVLSNKKMEAAISQPVAATYACSPLLTMKFVH